MKQSGSRSGQPSLARQVDADETVDGLAVVNSVLDALVGQAEALLHDVHAQHAGQADWRAAAARALWVVWFDASLEVGPRGDGVDLAQEPLPARNSISNSIGHS